MMSKCDVKILTDNSDTLNYKRFCKHCLFYMCFYYLHLRGTKSFVQKTELYLIFFGLVWGGIQCCNIKDSVFLVLLS